MDDNRQKQSSEYNYYLSHIKEILRANNFTGRGLILAYLDQPISLSYRKHLTRLHYYDADNSLYDRPEYVEDRTSMHGVVVSSIIKDSACGIIPHAELHYFAINHIDPVCSINIDLTNAMKTVMSVYMKLPEDKRFHVIGISNNPRSNQPGYEELLEMVNSKLPSIGIHTFFCGDYGALEISRCNNNRHSSDLKCAEWYYCNRSRCIVPREKLNLPDKIFVPTSGIKIRNWETYEIMTWENGGLSWTMPYMIGFISAIKKKFPNLSHDDIMKFIRDNSTISTIRAQYTKFNSSNGYDEDVYQDRLVVDPMKIVKALQ